MWQLLSALINSPEYELFYVCILIILFSTGGFSRFEFQLILHKIDVVYNNKMSYDIYFIIKTFTIVASLLGIACQLYLRHIDYSYSLVASGTAAGALLYDDNPLLSPFETIIKYENEAKDIFSTSAADWTIAHRSDSYQVEFRPTARNESSRSSSSSGLFRLTAELDTNLSELELFEYLSVGKGLSLLYPVRISTYCTAHTHLLTFSLDFLLY